MNVQEPAYAPSVAPSCDHLHWSPERRVARLSPDEVRELRVALMARSSRLGELLALGVLVGRGGVVDTGRMVLVREDVEGWKAAVDGLLERVDELRVEVAS